MKVVITLMVTSLAAGCIVEPEGETGWDEQEERTGTTEDELAISFKKRPEANACVDITCVVPGCTRLCTCPKTGDVYGCGCRNWGNGTNGEECDLLDLPDLPTTP